MIDALRIMELVEHGKAATLLIDEHQKGLERAFAMRLTILQTLIDLGMSQAEAGRCLGMTRNRVWAVLRDAGHGSP